MSERELASTMSDSSAALARMRSIAEIDWEKQHGHPAPCPPGCLILISAEQKAQETWGAIQPPPPARTTAEELARPHGGH